MTLAAKARLRLRGLGVVRIARAARSQRQAASLMPLRTLGPVVAQGGRAGGRGMPGPTLAAATEPSRRVWNVVSGRVFGSLLLSAR